MAMAPADGTQALRRGLAVVRHVAQQQRSGARLAGIARSTGLNRSTTFRILRAMTEERLLRFRAADRTYHIGPLAFELGLAVGSDAAAPQIWHDAVERVAQRSGLTSYLMARSEDEAVCLLCVQARSSVRAMPIEVGQRVPLGIGAGGLVLLTALDDAEVHDIASRSAERLHGFPAHGISAAEIASRVAEARRCGFSRNSGTVVRGISGVGVLIPDIPPHTGMAITVSAVTEEIALAEAEQLARMIREATQQVHRPPAWREIES